MSTLTYPAFAAWLHKMDACGAARRWVCEYRHDEPFYLRRLWADCPCGGWLMFLIERLGMDIPKEAYLAYDDAAGYDSDYRSTTGHSAYLISTPAELWHTGHFDARRERYYANKIREIFKVEDVIVRLCVVLDVGLP